MVDKKTVAIAVLCLATILFLGLWSSSAQEARRLEGELGELKDDYDKLALVRTNLEENYSELKTEKDDLEADHTSLVADYGEIVDQYSSLNSLYNTLKENYDALEDDLSGLTNTLSLYQDNYRALKEDYDELNALLEEGEAIAESAEWITKDERLKVTSKLIPKILWDSYLSSYTVKVTITNVGDEPIDKVAIFVFPYTDGKFSETYWEYHEHTVENIYIGETYSHDFTYLPKEMTSFKVLAVAG